MYNTISYGVDSLDSTATTLTFGVGPSQISPPRLLVWSGGSAGKVTLPLINSNLGTPPGTAGTTGVGDGFLITIKNTTAFALTVTPAASDTSEVTYVPAPGIINLMASAVDAKWYAPIAGHNANVFTTASAYTVGVRDRYVIMTGAVAVTLPTATAMPTGQVFTVVSGSGGPVTVTPAAGNISGVAAVTLATGASASVLSDGTNWQKVAG